MSAFPRNHVKTVQNVKTPAVDTNVLVWESGSQGNTATKVELLKRSQITLMKVKCVQIYFRRETLYFSSS